ncbi:MAG: hypothetical protein WC530_10535 [Candidatus Omnitrophota bacterium]|jgi:hypothetical protein
MKSIYDLKLHETWTDGNLDVLRVPGGWVYSIYGGVIFVPFDNEFMPKPPPNDDLPF